MDKIEIKKEKLILAEGQDVKWFCIHSLEKYREHDDTQVFDFGGIKELTKYLKMLLLLPKFNSVKSILIIRDAENNAEGAISSIKTSLEKNRLPCPKYPYTYIHGGNNKLKLAFAILPGTMNGDKYENGALEDLCMGAIQENTKNIIKPIESFIAEVESVEDQLLTHKHKSKLHIYLATQNDYVGLKIGEAARAGAWNWNHPVMSKLKTIIHEL